jgi:hypothetical protein
MNGVAVTQTNFFVYNFCTTSQEDGGEKFEFKTRKEIYIYNSSM